MTAPAITVEDFSKYYRLGLTHRSSVRELGNDLMRKLLRRRENVVAVASSNGADDTGQRDEAGFWALRDVSFSVEPGEVVGIIGHNGAGKSTLLKLLSRITLPTSGRAVLRGRIASLLEVGTGFHPEMTGRENVLLNGTILGMTRREVLDRFDDIVEFAGVERFIDTPVKRYSSGMTVRLGFAVAAHLNPEILIVDEVLAVGDTEFQRRCLSKMQSVAESGRTVLFVSHNLTSIRQLTQRCLHLKSGRVSFDGPTGEAIDHYINALRDVAAEQADDLSQTPRAFSGLSRAVEFLRLSLNDGERRLPIDAPLALDITLLANRDVPEQQIGMTLYRADETPVGSTFSGPVASMRAGERRTVSLRLDGLSLAPGRYDCSLSIGDVQTSGRVLNDSLRQQLPFEVLQPPLGERQWSEAWGAIRLPELRPAECVGGGER